MVHIAASSPHLTSRGVVENHIRGGERQIPVDVASGREFVSPTDQRDYPLPIGFGDVAHVAGRNQLLISCILSGENTRFGILPCTDFAGADE